MKARDILRTAVVKTNLHWPFSSLNKMPYYLAIKAFIRLCKKFPEIKSVYLRHGLTEENWVPALSDIDLTIIIDSGLNIEEEFSFLSSFWKNYDKMKKLFPMLGEVEILNEEHIGSWTKFNIRGYESRNWKLIHGIETAKSNYVVNSTRLAIDSLNHALWLYLDFFLRRFYREETPSFMLLQEMKRLALKVLRYANYPHLHPLKHKLDGRVGNKTAMLCCVLEELEKGVRLFAPNFDQNGLRKKPREWQYNIELRNDSFQGQALDTSKLEPFHEAIESMFFTYATNIVVLKSGLDASVMNGCIDMVNRIVPKGSIRPVIVSSYIFGYMLRFYNPFLYTDLVRRNSVAYGKDLLPDIQPPDIHHFIGKVLEQTATVLTFPQGRAIITATSPDWFSGREFESMVERSLFIKLYLEKGVIRPWHDELLAECQKQSPDYYKKLYELKKNAGYFTDGALSREAFGLLKGITGDIHKSISTSSLADDLFKMGESEDGGK